MIAIVDVPSQVVFYANSTFLRENAAVVRFASISGRLIHQAPTLSTLLKILNVGSTDLLHNFAVHSRSRLLSKHCFATANGDRTSPIRAKLPMQHW